MPISVVIPAYNVEKYIAEALTSVLGQTLQPDEIVVVDDGSTDRTAAIAESFAPRVRVLHTANVRAAAARNFGVQHTSGEWIAFLDADDVWEPNKLERQMEELARQPDADICYTGFIHLRQDGDSTSLGPVVTVPSTKRLRSHLLRSTTFIPSCTMIRRSTFLSVGGFDPDRRYAQDWHLWLRLLPTGAKFIPCHEPLMRYRTHSQNMSSNTRASLESAKEVYRRYAMPLLPAWGGWYGQRRFLAAYEAGAACAFRDQKNSEAMPLLITSIFRQPFCLLRRYKTLALMLLALLKQASVDLRDYELPTDSSAGRIGPRSLSTEG